jgi:hypothetical protein
MQDSHVHNTYSRIYGRAQSLPSHQCWRACAHTHTHTHTHTRPGTSRSQTVANPHHLLPFQGDSPNMGIGMAVFSRGNNGATHKTRPDQADQGPNHPVREKEVQCLHTLPPVALLGRPPGIHHLNLKELQPARHERQAAAQRHALSGATWRREVASDGLGRTRRRSHAAYQRHPSLAASAGTGR